MRYIEIVGAIGIYRHELTDGELQNIGKFTRVNVSMWMDCHTGPDWVGILPVEDFHAVCGDIDIPWATKEGFECYQHDAYLLVPRQTAGATLVDKVNKSK